MTRSPSWVPQRQDMAAVRRPHNASLAPDCFGHRRRHDGIVAGSKGKHRAMKLVLSLSRVPMHQPIEPFIKSGDVEDLWQGKAGRAARPPEGLQRPGRLALEPALQGCYARRRNVATEAVEAMHADKGPKAASPVLE